MLINRRTFIGVSAGAAVAATLAACSSQAGSGSGGSSSGGITLWTHNGGNTEELGVVKEAVDAFNKANPDTPVTLKDFPRSRTTTPSPPRRSAETCPTSSTSTARSCPTGPGPATSHR